MKHRVLVSWCLAIGVTAASGRLRADERRPVFIWYRSGGECPDGDAFLSRLAGKVDQARIASAGDPIDFVVTLGSLGTRSNGRLERETLQGTVAIRELDGSACTEVADALALSLALAIDPAENLPPREEDPDLPPATAPKPPLARPRVNQPVDRVLETKPRSARWSLGAQVQVASAVAPSVLPGGMVFVDFEQTRSSVLPGASLRLGVFGMFGSASTDVGAVRHRLLGIRLEGCPLRVGDEALALKPCASFELGQLRAEGTDSDTGLADDALWASVGASGRVAWGAFDGLAFEAQAGIFAPLTRYQLRTEDPGSAGHRTSFLGFSAGLGASARWP